MKYDANTLFSGDNFGRFFEDNRSRMVAFAFGYVRNRLVAEDLVTDAFVYVWENRERLTADVNVAAYLFTTVRHKCLNFLRGEEVRLCGGREMQELHLRVVRENIRSLEICDPEHLYAGEIEELVRKCMEQMPELAREVFAANRLRGDTYRQVAERLGITERRVETELTKALALLRRALGNYLPAVLVAAVLERFIR